MANAVADGHKAAKEARTIAAAARVQLAKDLLETQANTLTLTVTLTPTPTPSLSLTQATASAANAALSLAEAQASVDAASGVDLKVFEHFEAEWASGDFPRAVEAQLAAVASLQLHNPLVHQGTVAKELVADPVPSGRTDARKGKGA